MARTANAVKYTAHEPTAVNTMDGESHLFHGLLDSDLAAFSAHATRRSFRRNAILLSEGDASASFYVIESGRVKFYLSDEEGRDVILGRAGAGDYFGELSLLAGTPRSASVAALEDTTLLITSREQFMQVVQSNSDLALRLLTAMALKLRELSDEIRALALTDVYSRVIRLLQRLAREQDGQTVVIDPLTHQQIAEMVGSSREMVSRIMAELIRGEYIEKRERRICLLKPFPRRW